MGILKKAKKAPARKRAAKPVAEVVHVRASEILGVDDVDLSRRQAQRMSPGGGGRRLGGKRVA